MCGCSTWGHSQCSMKLDGEHDWNIFVMSQAYLVTTPINLHQWNLTWALPIGMFIRHYVPHQSVYWWSLILCGPLKILIAKITVLFFFCVSELEVNAFLKKIFKLPKKSQIKGEMLMTVIGEPLWLIIVITIHWSWPQVDKSSSYWPKYYEAQNKQKRISVEWL